MDCPQMLLNFVYIDIHIDIFIIDINALKSNILIKHIDEKLLGNTLIITMMKHFDETLW